MHFALFPPTQKYKEADDEYPRIFDSLVSGSLDAEGPYEAGEPFGPRKPLALRGDRKVLVYLQLFPEAW